MIEFSVETEIARAPEFEPPTLFALRIIEGLMRLASPLLGRTIKRQFAQHCSNLKRVLESPSQL